MNESVMIGLIGIKYAKYKVYSVVQKIYRLFAACIPKEVAKHRLSAKEHTGNPNRKQCAEYKRQKSGW